MQRNRNRDTETDTETPKQKQRHRNRDRDTETDTEKSDGSFSRNGQVRRRCGATSTDARRCATSYTPCCAVVRRN